MEHHRGHELLVGVFFGGRRRRVYTELAERSGARPGDQVLDVGCGNGYFTRVMAGAVAPGGTAVGVDPSASSIARARQVTRAGNCTFSLGIAEDLDMEDGSVDVVVSSLMLHHLPEELRARAIGEMHRVLRPGGRLLVADFRPPASRLAGLLIAPMTSPAMRGSPMQLVEPMVGAAGFAEVHVGVARPWFAYLQAVKPGDGT